MCALCVVAEYVLDTQDGRNMLYVYDKLNSFKPVRDAQAMFDVGAYYHNAMKCLIFPSSGTDVLKWLEDSQRVVMTERADVEGAQPQVEPLFIPDDL